MVMAVAAHGSCHRRCKLASSAAMTTLGSILLTSPSCPIAFAAPHPLRPGRRSPLPAAFVGAGAGRVTVVGSRGGASWWATGDDEATRVAADPVPPSTPQEGNGAGSAARSLLQGAMSRAMRTLSADLPDSHPRDSSASDDRRLGSTVGTITAAVNRSSSTLAGGGGSSSVEGAIDAALDRSSSVLAGTESAVPNDGKCEEGGNPPRRKREDKRTYLGNPGVTPTALAHSLWRSAIIPHRDTVIDATCGNGKDCLALARMLFPDAEKEDAVEHDGASPRPQLIGIDVQARAIRNTRLSLLSSLPPDVYYDHIALLEQSHEHLADVPRDKSSVGLVCYNLGYLPGAPSGDDPGASGGYKELMTQTETTLSSVTDASFLLRPGGLLSVMTYPGSNFEESEAVARFAEGLAMLTTRDPGGWRGYAEGIPDIAGGDGRVRDLVTRALERVASEGSTGQTWRAFAHRPMGRPLSPVLVTATRIK